MAGTGCQWAACQWAARVASRPATLGYLTQVAQAAEQLGFVGALTPAGAWCQDAWLTTAMLVAHTERLRFLVAFRPWPRLRARARACFDSAVAVGVRGGVAAL